MDARRILWHKAHAEMQLASAGSPYGAFISQFIRGSWLIRDNIQITLL